MRGVEVLVVQAQKLVLTAHQKVAVAVAVQDKQRLQANPVLAVMVATDTSV